MQKTQKLLFILLATASLNAYADSVCVSHDSVLRCSEGTTEQINFSGVVDIDGTTVNQGCKILGNADIQNAHLHQVSVRGATGIEQSDIRGTLDITGNLHAKKVDISGDTRIVGDLSGKNLTFSNKTKIVGTMNCDKCIFKSDTTLVGDIEASNTEILGPLALNARISTFKSSKLNDITVAKPSDNEEQEIQLKDGTTAHNIKFESQKGIVVLNGNAKITGTVEGGKVVAN